MFARQPVRILGCALLATLSFACSTTGTSEPTAPEPRGAIERLRELQPADVAVAPVRDQTDAQRVPLEVFRNAFNDTLIERRYSPLASKYVDANWIEASFKGTPPPDAVLVVAVTAWDPSHLFSTGVVEAAADVVLFEGGDTTGRVLWQLSYSGAVDLGDGRGNPPAGGTDLIPVAARRFAQQALATLPMRDPAAAVAPAPAGEAH